MQKVRGLTSATRPLNFVLFCFVFLFFLGRKDYIPDRLGAFSIYQKNSRNYGWDVNGTRLFGSIHWKFSEVNGISEKVVLISGWKLPNGNLCSIYRFLVFIASSIPFAVFQAARPPLAPSNGTCDKWSALFPNRNS